MRFLTYSSLLLLSAPVLAQNIVTETETNDTFGTANAVSLGDEVRGALTAGDSDWFSITSPGGQHRFTINGTTDTRLELIASDGTTILAGNDDSRSLQSDITINLAAGSYFLRVFGFSATTAGAYALDVSRANPLKGFTSVEVEPKQLIGDAGVYTLGADEQVDGNRGAAGDIDLYRIVLTQDTGLWFQVTEGNTPWTSQHRIQFYDAAGALLLPTGTLGTNAIDSGSFTFRNSQIRVWPAGTYYVGVVARSAAPSYNPVPLGNYRLEVKHLPLNTAGLVAEPDAVGANTNGTFGTATALTFGQTGTGHVTNSTGTDPNDFWGPFVIPAGGYTVLFQTRQLAGGPSGTPLLDSTIRLVQLDTCTNLLGTPTSVTTGNILSPTSHARGAFSFFAPGTYYLEVVSPGTTAAQTGDYALEVSDLLPAPYAAAVYSIFAANGSCGVAPFPTITRTNANEVPTKGQVFSRRITGLDPGTIGVFLHSYATLCPLNTTPGPFALGPSCFINMDLGAGAGVIWGFETAGVFEWNLFLPATRSLRGAILFEQAVEVNISVPEAQWGNWARLIVGDRSY